jgi:hypothetical protein
VQVFETCSGFELVRGCLYKSKNKKGDQVMNIPFGVITTIIKRNRDQVKSKSPGSPQGITNYCYSNTVGNLF